MKKFIVVVLSSLMLVSVFCAISCTQTTHEHNFVKYTYNQDATCYFDGTKTAKCTYPNCNENKTITAEGTKLDHDYVTKSDSDQHWQECVCGDKKDIEEHVFSNYIYNQDATCSSDGTKSAKCDGCDEIDTVIATGTRSEHVYGKDWLVDEQMHWKQCSCSDKTSFESHAFKWVIDTEATQVTTGLKHKECSVCGYKTMLNTQIPVLDHTHNYSQAVVSEEHLKASATCTTKAEYYYSCTCGESGTLTFKYGESLGHSYTQYVYNEDATCTSDGTKTATCDRCVSTSTEIAVGTRLGHSYGEEWCIDEQNHWKECVCEDITSLSSHTLGWIIDVEASTTQTGLKHKECSVCGYKTEIGTIIPMVGHSHSYTFVKTVSPTCANQGYDLYKCSCGQENKTNLVDALDHSYENADCPTCLEWMNKDYSHLDKYNDDYGYVFLGTMSNGDKLQALYQKIDAKIKLFHENKDIDATTITISGQNMLQVASVKFSDLGLSSDVALSVWDTYLNDNPLYYWISKTVAWSSTNLILLTEQEYDTGEERSAINQKIYSAIQTQLSIIDQSQSAYRKALAYHDAIINKVNYAYDSNGDPETSIWAHNIDGVLNGNSSVCEGYSRTFQLLLNCSGVDNVCVTGIANGGAHAWNMIKLDDGKWYWCDLTWDDTNCKTPYTDVNSLPSIYDYFCVAGQTFNNHTPHTSAVHGTSFLYDLPTPSSSAYAGDELLLNQSFVVDGITYVKVASGLLELKLIQKTGAVTIPESVVYNGVAYKVVSVANKTVNGNQITCGSVISGQVTQISLPSTVKIIYPGAFNGCNTLTKVTISNGTTVIGDSAFSSCNLLEDVVIPSSVISIGNSAFRSCTRLDKIEFTGTKAEWQAITKGTLWNDFTGSYIVSCKDGNISKVNS
ncbi:MAG: hypothetical protein E7348_03905 [Clostridiales bacterium]|nr:hypothetical protein [Clostridiales bacterium]